VIVLIPDSNALHGNPHLAGSLGEMLAKEFARGDVALQFAPVVMEELRRQEHDDIAEIGKTVNGLVNKKTRGSGAKMPGVFDRIDALLDDIHDEVEARFTETLARADLIFREWPDVTSRAMVEREIARRRPFLETKDGTIGHRDTSLWESVREAAREGGPDQVVILIANDNGFWNAEKTALAEDLLVDLDSDGTDRSRVEIVPDFSRARIRIQEMRSEITPEHAAVAREFVALAVSFEGQDLAVALDIFPTEDGGESMLDIPLEITDTSIVGLDLVGEPVFEPGTSYIVTQDAELTIGGTMHVADWYVAGDDVDLWANVNDHYVEVGVYRQVKIKATLRYDDGDVFVASLDILAKPTKPSTE
jgi:hypothetical protein